MGYSQERMCAFLVYVFFKRRKVSDTGEAVVVMGKRAWGGGGGIFHTAKVVSLHST